jgi:hypothetical protein
MKEYCSSSMVGRARGVAVGERDSQRLIRLTLTRLWTLPNIASAS